MSTMSDHPNKTTAFALLGFTVLVWGAAPAFIRSFSLTTGPTDALVIRLIAVAIPCLLLLPFFGGYTVARVEAFCKVLTALPYEGHGALLYRVRSEREAFDRVVGEGDLSR